MQFLLCLFIVTATSVEIGSRHAQLHRAMSDLAPKDVKKSIDDFHYLLGLGEDSRALALKNLTIRQKIFDDAQAAHEDAVKKEQAALGDQRQAEEDEKKAIEARNEAIKTKEKRIKEKTHADSWIAPAKKHMEEEQKRVAEERVALEKVKKILEDLLKNGGKAKVEGSRRLLTMSRTVTLLTAPSFIASLEKADPGKVKSVLEIVNNLIKEGEEAQKKAEDAYADVLAKAKIAQDNLDAAIKALADREADLLAATAHKNKMIALAQAASAHEDEMYRIRDEMKALLDEQADFTAREIRRIDFEREILLEAVNLQGQLHRVTQLLA